MPRVTHVKAARKDNPVAKKGESYYWWKFRYGGKRYSLTYPKASQLTQSAYFGTVYSMQEEVEAWEGEDVLSFEGLKEDILGQVEELREETQSSLDNMPDQLQYSPTGELLQERVDALDSAESDIECIDEPDDAEEFDREEFDREEFDGSDIDDEDDRLEAEEEHDEEQDELERQHDQEQSDLEGEHNDEQESIFRDWIENAKSELTDALDGAIV